MKRFIANAICILGITVAILAANLVASIHFEKMNEDSIMHAWVDKVDMLEKTGEGGTGRIILVGGSNLLMGIDSKAIEDRFNVEVVNLGLHAGMGLKYMFDIVDKYVHEGDIVVIVPEYEQFNEESMIGGYTLFQVLTMEYAPLDFDQFLSLAYDSNIYTRGSIRWVAKVLGLWSNPSLRTEINENGDMVSHLDKKRIVDISKETSLSGFEVSPKRVKMVNWYTEKFRSKGADVYLSFPCFPETLAEQSQEEMKDYERVFAESLDVQVISSPYDFVYPDDYFYDTKYHLTKEGRDLRTEDLISKLEPYIN